MPIGLNRSYTVHRRDNQEMTSQMSHVKGCLKDWKDFNDGEEGLYTGERPTLNAENSSVENTQAIIELCTGAVGDEG